MYCKIVKIDENNLEIYMNLAYAYEAEFSNLTKKMPNELGIFQPDTLPINPYCGYLLMYNNKPIGFSIVEINSQYNDVAEFYIIPIMRKNGYGKELAKKTFDYHSGLWYVRQIAGAEQAKQFWRKVINEYSSGQYLENEVLDEKWGKVTRQEFISNPSNQTTKESALIANSLFNSILVETEKRIELNEFSYVI